MHWKKKKKDIHYDDGNSYFPTDKVWLQIINGYNKNQENQNDFQSIKFFSFSLSFSLSESSHILSL